MIRKEGVLLCMAALLCLALSHVTACSGRSGLGASGSMTAAPASRLDINMTEKQVIELMKNNGEVVAILPGDAHTYKIKGTNLRIVYWSEVDEDTEWLVTVNFRNGLVSSFGIVPY